MTDADPRYPIGPFRPTDRPLTDEERRARIGEIRMAPAQLRSALEGLDDAQLDTPYREGGWTLRQVAHHVPDSHLNAYVRFRWALTEDEPLIKTYEEARWAELPDARTGPIEPSLRLLDDLHARWLMLLDAMEPADFRRTLRHPEMGRTLALDTMAELYAWHGRHHTAHVTSLRKREGW